MRSVYKFLIVMLWAIGVGMVQCFTLPTSAEAEDVWAYTDHTGEYYVCTETIKDKYIEPHNRQYTKQWFQVNVKEVKNGKLINNHPWSFMQIGDGSWGYNPYPLLSMDERAEAIFKVAMKYR